MTDTDNSSSDVSVADDLVITSTSTTRYDFMDIEQMISLN